LRLDGRETFQQEKVRVALEPVLRGSVEECRSQPRDALYWQAPRGHEGRHGGQGCTGKYSYARSQMRRMAGNQHVPVGVHRPDVDPIFSNAVEYVACCHQLAEHLSIERWTPGRAVLQQLVAEGVESGLRVRHRPA